MATIIHLSSQKPIDVYTNMIQPAYHNFQTTNGAPIGEMSHFIKFTLLKSVLSIKNYWINLIHIIPIDYTPLNPDAQPRYSSSFYQ